MIHCLALAWALDFTPTHDGEATEAPDPPSLDTEAPVDREPPTVPAEHRQLLAYPEERPSRLSWMEPSSLELAVSGDHGRRYYVVATAFVGPEQYHWQEGPIDAPDSTVTFSLDLPAEVASAVTSEGHGQLSLQMWSTDFGEISIRPHDPPEGVYLLRADASVVGASRASNPTLPSPEVP